METTRLRILFNSQLNSGLRFYFSKSFQELRSTWLLPVDFLLRRLFLQNAKISWRNHWKRREILKTRKFIFTMKTAIKALSSPKKTIYGKKVLRILEHELSISSSYEQLSTLCFFSLVLCLFLCFFNASLSSFRLFSLCSFFPSTPAVFSVCSSPPLRSLFCFYYVFCLCLWLCVCDSL